MSHLNKARIAIVGAGVSGLSCARILKQTFENVTVFDKGRFSGGRLASRTRDQNQFDYGAQYFTARSQSFKEIVESLVVSGHVSEWQGKIGRFKDNKFQPEGDSIVRYVGVPSMRTLAERLGEGIDCRFNHVVQSILKHGKRWTIDGFVKGLHDQKFSHEFDMVILSIPPEQAFALTHEQWLKQVYLAPCLAGMFSFGDTLPFEYDGIFVDDTELSWVARDSSKPKRPDGERWVVHATPSFSDRLYEKDDKTIIDALFDQFQKLSAAELPEPTFKKCHRWKYALPNPALEKGYHIDQENNLAFCGDWCYGARVEGAFLSGQMLAKNLVKN